MLTSDARLGPAEHGRAVLPPLVPQLVALAGLGAAVTSLVMAQVHDVALGYALLICWIVLSYVVSGALAWWRRPASRFGPLMILAGFATFLSTLSWADDRILHTIGMMFDLLPLVLILHVFLAFPTGHLVGRFDRLLLIVGYVTAIGGQLVVMVLGGFGPEQLLAVTDHAAAIGLHNLELVVISVVAIGGVVLLAARRRSEGRPLRRSFALLIDSFALGLLMIALLLLAGAFAGRSFATIQLIALAVLGLAPLAFLAGLMNARLARSSVGDLVLVLREPLVDLRDPLARALGDPSLTISYWLPPFESWADREGRAVTLPSQDSGRAVTFIAQDGAPVAALVHDPGLNDEPELLDAVCATAGFALENARLRAEQQAHLDELRESRERVIEAALKERQRLERDLHDGAQQRLVALSMELGLLEIRTGLDMEAHAILAQAKHEIAASLDELRSLARGLYPAVLTAHGLEVALESLAARAAVPVRLTVDVAGRLTEKVEVAAYYVVCESLANVAKHANAATATVEVVRSGDHVIVEVIDDGVGGASTDGGTGLRGLADRVEALGGRLRVWTPRGRGTRVRAEIPCGSR